MSPGEIKTTQMTMKSQAIKKITYRYMLASHINKKNPASKPNDRITWKKHGYVRRVIDQFRNVNKAGQENGGLVYQKALQY